MFNDISFFQYWLHSFKCESSMSPWLITISTHAYRALTEVKWLLLPLSLFPRNSLAVVQVDLSKPANEEVDDVWGSLTPICASGGATAVDHFELHKCRLNQTSHMRTETRRWPELSSPRGHDSVREELRSSIGLLVLGSGCVVKYLGSSEEAPCVIRNVWFGW